MRREKVSHVLCQILLIVQIIAKKKLWERKEKREKRKKCGD